MNANGDDLRGLFDEGPEDELQPQSYDGFAPIRDSDGTQIGWEPPAGYFILNDGRVMGPDGAIHQIDHDGHLIPGYPDSWHSIVRQQAFHRELSRLMKVARRIKNSLRLRLALADDLQIERELDYLYDPIEDVTDLHHIFEKAELQAMSNLAALGVSAGKGYCVHLWREKAEVLANRYGITWLSPAELNPGTLYD